MVNFNGSTTINNTQINDNVQGDVTMNVGMSAEDVSMLVAKISSLSKDYGINDPELNEILSQPTDDADATVSRLGLYVENFKEAITTGEAAIKFGGKAVEFCSAISAML